MRWSRARQLVVDVSVVAAAGGSEHPPAKACRDVLSAILRVCHRVVVTSEIEQEWRRHRSRWAWEWLGRMVRRGKRNRMDVPPNRELRDKLSDAAKTEATADAMLKDVNLLEAALAADKIVISRDDAARALFAHASTSIHELKSVVWVNPETHGCDRVMSWLQRGAPLDEDLRLGRGPFRVEGS